MGAAGRVVYNVMEHRCQYQANGPATCHSIRRRLYEQSASTIAAQQQLDDSISLTPTALSLHGEVRLHVTCKCQGSLKSALVSRTFAETGAQLLRLLLERHQGQHLLITINDNAFPLEQDPQAVCQDRPHKSKPLQAVPA